MAHISNTLDRLLGNREEYLGSVLLDVIPWIILSFITLDQLYCVC